MKKIITRTAKIVSIAFIVTVFAGCAQQGGKPKNVHINTQPGAPVTDIDGNTYKTVIINGDTWMAENLKTTHFNDGTRIVNAVDNKDGFANHLYCWYKSSKEEYGDIYGALYNYNCVSTGKLCPEGWEIPSDNAWYRLIEHCQGNVYAGHYLKEKGRDHWKTTASATNNKSGFTALPGGKCGEYYGKFSDVGEKGYWWGENVRALVMSADASSVSLAFFKSNDMHSVRCIKSK